MVIKIYNGGNQLLTTYTSESNSCSIDYLYTNEAYETLIITATSYPGKYNNLFNPSSEVEILKLKRTDNDIKTHDITYIKDLTSSEDYGDDVKNLVD